MQIGYFYCSQHFKYGVFQGLMLDSAKTKNVIEATNKPELYEKLEDLQKRFILIFDFYYTAKFCAYYSCISLL